MIRPVVVSQRTCEAVLGCGRRWWLEYLAEHPEVPRVVLGRQTLVRVDDWLAHMAKHAVTTPAVQSPDREWTPAEILARRGLRVVGGAK